MEAAFVEIGLEKNGFLYVDEIVAPELEGRRHGRRIQDLLSRGQEILVQAVKDPMKTKGARLTTEISLPGRFVVYVPQGEGVGVSRRLEDDERARLREILRKIALPKGGVIVRTAAEGASEEDIERDIRFLEKVWKEIQARAKSVPAPSLVYSEAELPLRVVRDLFTGDFVGALVDDDLTYKRIVGYLKKTSPHMAERVTRHREKEPLFEAYGVDAEIRSTLNRRVDRPSFGESSRLRLRRSIHGDRRQHRPFRRLSLEDVGCAAGGHDHEEQPRGRQGGRETASAPGHRGDHRHPLHRHGEPEEPRARRGGAQQELERDRTKTYVVEISPLGLAEMTRQNVTDGPREILTKRCPTCAGDGIVISEASAAVETEQRLRALASQSPRTKAFSVEVNPYVAAMLVGPGAQRLEEIESATKRRFFLKGIDGAPLDHFTVLDKGTIEKLAPAAPVQEGQEIDVKLVEVGLHDPESGIAKLDGYDVCVGEAARLVGKKIKVRVERVLDGTAYASLVGGAVPQAAPITAEGMAEKPTRGPRAPKVSGVVPEELPESVSDPVEEIAEIGEVDEPGPEAEDAGVTDAADKPKRKRTRRGSRGRQTSQEYDRRERGGLD